jgi:hypothetical protein
LALVLFPVLHDHGDAGGAASVLLLLNEWDVKPQAREAWGCCGSAHRKSHNRRNAGQSE